MQAVLLPVAHYLATVAPLVPAELCRDHKLLAELELLLPSLALAKLVLAQVLEDVDLVGAGTEGALEGTHRPAVAFWQWLRWRGAVILARLATDVGAHPGLGPALAPTVGFDALRNRNVHVASIELGPTRATIDVNARFLVQVDDL